MSDRDEHPTVLGPARGLLQQPRRGGGAAAPAASAPGADRHARLLHCIDVATGMYGVLWHLFLSRHLTKPLAGRELALFAAQLAVLVCAVLTALLAPRAWLQIR